MKRLLAVFLFLAMLLAAGCTAKAPEQTATLETEPLPAGETILGYVPSEVAKPEWLASIWGWDTCGDTIWLGGKSTEGSLLAASYDTIHGQWQRFDLDTGDAHGPSPVNLSVAGDSLWILLQESFTVSELQKGAVPEDLGYDILYMDLSGGISICVHIPFSAGTSTESGTSAFFSVQALEKDRALLTTHETAYWIDPAVNRLDQPALSLAGKIYHMWVKGQLYVRFSDGFAPYDEESHQFGDAISLRERGNFSSNAGKFLSTVSGTLYQYDLESGEKTELFPWLDVALSYREMGGSQVFENSAGVFYYTTSSKLIQIEQKPVLPKETLTLVCFGDSSDDMYEYQTAAYSYSDELMDAVVRFNNTDPEFKIEIKPAVYSDEAERDRLLVELATSDDIDLVDTSLLPENALKEGLLVDMLPYIDADEAIGRDDFIQPLLNAMMRNGALYEYTDKFTMLTMITRPEVFSGPDTWTIENIRELLLQHPEFCCVSRGQMQEGFILAATAEFIDWDTMTCSFDSAAFQNWLSFLKEQPEVIEWYEDPLLFQITNDFAFSAGPWARITMWDADYVVSGFPEAKGTGSYFTKLTGFSDPESPTVGDNTRLGILASGKHHDGAWRFVRTLILGDGEDNIAKGIPVIKKRFDKAIDVSAIEQYNSVQEDFFKEQDAQMLREQVYNTTKLVHSDEALLNIIRSEAAACFAGQKSVEDAAMQIQSRISIYLAEQG